MKAVVVYESMYGNTHLVADAIAEGLRVDAEAVVVPVDQAVPELLEIADLVVVGGPTHVHSMSRASTRKNAVDVTHKPGNDLTVDPDAEGPGLRDWFDALNAAPRFAAAFDTRFDMVAAITGRASKGISHRLRKHGCTMVAKPMSFFVTKHNHLEDDETGRARNWGMELSRIVMKRLYDVAHADASGTTRS
jgi:menaquinone-dependent protoporphyrinogen IX oxidase